MFCFAFLCVQKKKNQKRNTSKAFVPLCLVLFYFIGLWTSTKYQQRILVQKKGLPLSDLAVEHFIYNRIF